MLQPVMNKEDNSVPLNVYHFCPKRKTLSCSEHLNWTVLRPQEKPGIERPYATGQTRAIFFL